MSYQYHPARGSPYAGAHPTQPSQTRVASASRPTVQQQPYDGYGQDTSHIISDYYANDSYSNWDNQSYRSNHSQVHLKSQPDMNTNVPNAPPVPSLPYEYQAYPPAQQPLYDYNIYSAYGGPAGYSSAREKLLRRRVNAHLL